MLCANDVLLGRLSCARSLLSLNFYHLGLRNQIVRIVHSKCLSLSKKINDWFTDLISLRYYSCSAVCSLFIDVVVDTPFTRYNRLSNRLYNRFDNRLYYVNKHPTGCQTGLTTGWMFVYTIQPVVKRVWQPVWQPCWTNSHCSFNRVERTASVRSTGCQTGCQTGLTTGWMFVYMIQPVVLCKWGLT